jgi:hypothetical protein
MYELKLFSCYFTLADKTFFSAGIVLHKDAIREDFKKTGKCRLYLARDGFSNALVSFALPKNSKFTKTISKGCVIIKLLK